MTLVDIPGSKSVTARGLFLAAAARGTTVLGRPLHSDDTEGFAEGLVKLGYQVDRRPDAWTIEGRTRRGRAWRPPTSSAATAPPRPAFCPRWPRPAPARSTSTRPTRCAACPLGPLTDALQELGVDLTFEGEPGHHPLTVRANGVKGGDLTLDAGLSSQFLTALLLLGPLTAEGLRITVTDLVSVPYVEITLEMMRRFGVDVRREGKTFVVPPQPYQACDYPVEPDASTASYFLAAAAVTGRTVTIPGLGSTALQGDVRFVDVLERMGAHVQLEEDSVTVAGPSDGLRGVTVNMRDISDTVPTLAAIAPFASGPVRIEDVYNTRIKECDRLDACEENLRAMGVSVETGRDWIEIQPGVPAGALVKCRRDHRIAMAFSITGLLVDGITLDDPECVKKTFPGFHQALGSLRESWGI